MRRYIVLFKKREDLIVEVKDDVNRPNNPDCDTVLENWISENYGNAEYEYLRLDDLETIKI